MIELNDLIVLKEDAEKAKAQAEVQIAEAQKVKFEAESEISVFNKLIDICMKKEQTEIVEQNPQEMIPSQI